MITFIQPRTIKVYFEYWPVTWLWPISLVFMQVTLLRLNGFCLTLAVIVVHLLQLYLLMFYWVSRPSDRQVMIALGVLFYTLTLGLFAADPVEFGRSLAHIVNLVITVLLCLNLRLDDGREIRRSIAVFCVLAAGAGLLIIAQALTFNLLRDFQLANALGPLAPLGPGHEVYLPSPLAALPRANGLYSEPSVAGWFMGFATAVALGARRLYPVLTTVAALICGLAAMATLSLTGVLGASIVLLGYVLFVRDRRVVKLCWLLLAGVGVTIGLYAAYRLGILARFQHLDQPGTSIYFRLTAPLTLIGESLDRFPLGYPVGQTDFIATRDYYINWENGSQTNIDNTLFMIVFYFGLVGILANATYLVQMGRFLMRRRHAIGLIMLSLVIALMTTGAGWAHHFVLMIGYAILVGRYLHSHELAPRLSPARLRRLIRPRSTPWPAPGRRPAVRPRVPWRLAGSAP